VTDVARHVRHTLQAWTERVDAGTVRLRLTGQLDWEHADEARRAIDKIRQDPPRQLLIDASGVHECDAVGVAVLTAACFRVRAAGGTAVLSASPAIQRTVEQCRLGRYLHLERRPKPVTAHRPRRWTQTVAVRSGACRDQASPVVRSAPDRTAEAAEQPEHGTDDEDHDANGPQDGAAEQ
jgi:anti-anti-sigma factor